MRGALHPSSRGDERGEATVKLPLHFGTQTKDIFTLDKEIISTFAGVQF
jgi:hypothetical protein